MKCVECEVHYSAHLDGELDGILARRVREHLEACVTCQEQVERMREALTALRGLSAGQAASGFEDRVLLAVQGNSIPVASIGRELPRLLSARRLAVAAMLLLCMALGFGLGRLVAGRPAVPVEQEMARMGLRKVDGQWISVADLARAEKGMVFVDRAWRLRDEATALLLREQGYSRGVSKTWMAREERANISRGLYRGQEGWLSAGQIAAAYLCGNGLVRAGKSWVEPELKLDLEQKAMMLKEHWVFVDGDWLSPDEYDERLLEKNGLVRLEDGSWERRGDLENSRGGYVQVNGDWVKPGELVAAWMQAHGYALADGRWRDAKAPRNRRPGPAQRTTWEELPQDQGLLAQTDLTKEQRNFVEHLGPGRLRGAFHSGVRRRRLRLQSNPGGWLVKLKGTVDYQPLGTPAYADNRVFIGGGLNSREVYTFDASRGKLEWAMKLADNGPSSPVVWGDSVYYATESCTLYALNAGSGRRNWARVLASSLYSMPTVGTGKVTVSFPCVGGFALAAFDAEVGGTRWCVPLPGDSIVAPAMVGDRVYVTTRAGSVHCYDLTLGKQLWARDVHALAPVVRLDARRLLVRRAVRMQQDPDPRYYDYGARYGEVQSILDAGTGRTLVPALGTARRLPTNSLASLFPDRFKAPARARAVAGNAAPRQKVVVGSRPGVGARWGNTCFTIRGDTLEAVNLLTRRREWVLTLEEAGAGGAAGMQVRNPYLAATDPCVAGGMVFLGTLKGDLLCLDAASGALKWKENLGRPLGNYAGPSLTMTRVQPIVARGRVYLTTLKGELVCVDTGDRKLDGPHMWGAQPK